jgi:hypothetical protein
MLPQLKQLLETGVYQPAPAPVPLGTHGSWADVPQSERQAQCRVVMTAERAVPELFRLKLCTLIKVWRGVGVGGVGVGAPGGKRQQPSSAHSAQA